MINTIIVPLSRYFSSPKIPSISRDQLLEKSDKIARKILQIGIVSAITWGCRSINTYATFFGFTLGSCFFYSSIREILDDFSLDRLANTASVTQAVLILIGKMAADLIPWGITFSVFATATAVGVYTRGLITPVENKNISKKEPMTPRIQSPRNQKINGKISNVILHKISSVAWTSIIAFIFTLFNWTLCWHGPNVSPAGFWYGFVLHKLANKQWNDIKKYSVQFNWVSLVGGLGITTMVCYPKKELVQNLFLFTLSAMMGNYTYYKMFSPNSL